MITKSLIEREKAFGSRYMVRDHTGNPVGFTATKEQAQTIYDNTMRTIKTIAEEARQYKFDTDRPYLNPEHIAFRREQGRRLEIVEI